MSLKLAPVPEKKGHRPKITCNFLETHYFLMRFFKTISTHPETHESGLHHAQKARSAEGEGREVPQVDIFPENLALQNTNL